MDEKVGDVFQAYEEIMKRSNALDFNDLLVKTVDLFQSQPEVLAFYQDRFRYIMVDEYQDTNRVQYLLVQLLARKYEIFASLVTKIKVFILGEELTFQTFLILKKIFPTPILLN